MGQQQRQGVCAPEIPPQTANMSSPRFSSGGPGEWSDATRSTSPPTSSRARSSPARRRIVAAGRTWPRPPAPRRRRRRARGSAGRSRRSRRAARRAPRRSGRTPRPAGDVHHVQRAAGVAGQREGRPTAASSAGDRPRGGQSRMPRRPSATPGAAGAPVSAGSSACTATGSPSAAARSMPAAEGLVVGRRELVDAARAHEGLEADHAALGELVHALERARHQPAPQREVDAGGAAGRGHLGVEGGGVEGRRMALSGMSTQQVAPPAASAGCRSSKPSQSARPGSLRCTWASTTPGQHLAARGRRSPGGRPRAPGRSRRSTPSTTATSAPSPRTTRSWITRLKGPPRATASRGGALVGPGGRRGAAA